MVSPTTTAALIQGGTALLGGMLQDKGPSLKRQHSLARLSQQKLARDLPAHIVAGAQNAGFNPLTLLRSTGGSVGTATQANISPLGQRSAIGDAIAQFGATYAQDAIQKETEQRQNEEWTRRYDYDLANRPKVSPVSQIATPSTDNKIKIGGDRASDYRIETGDLAGRYVLPIGGQYKLAPQGWVPAGLTEDLFAGLASEVEGVTSNLSHRAWPVVSVAKDGTVRLPAANKETNVPLAIEIPTSP